MPHNRGGGKGVSPPPLILEKKIWKFFFGKKQHTTNTKKTLKKGHIVGLAQELPQSHLQYTDNPLHNTVMNHSAQKTVYHKSIKL